MGHENGGWMNDDQRDHSRWLSEQAGQTHGCHDCGEERFPRTVGNELSCPECGSKNIVNISLAESKRLAEIEKREAFDSVEPAHEMIVSKTKPIDAFRAILGWCDRSGEEPEGQCLHEIEQICRKQLGLELLVTSRALTPEEHTEERIKNATEGAVDAYDE